MTHVCMQYSPNTYSTDVPPPLQNDPRLYSNPQELESKTNACVTTGEFPVSDFTPMGKFIAGIIGCFAVGVFAIPVGILGAGFEEYVLAEKERTAAAVESGALCRTCGDLLFPLGKFFRPSGSVPSFSLSSLLWYGQLLSRFPDRPPKFGTTSFLFQSTLFTFSRPPSSSVPLFLFLFSCYQTLSNFSRPSNLVCTSFVLSLHLDRSRLCPTDVC